MKEYTNQGEAQDETVVKIEKSSSVTKEERYTFTTTKGINYGIGGNIGAQVLGLSVAGGSAGISAQVNKTKTKTEETETKKEEGKSASYNQEEKNIIPPGKRVKAKITTYSMKYSINYTIKFSIKKDATIPVMYKNSFQQCIGMCSNNGRVYVRDMINTLQDYNDDDEDDTISYTQPGTLSWVGEGCKVDKVEETMC